MLVTDKAQILYNKVYINNIICKMDNPTAVLACLNFHDYVVFPQLGVLDKCFSSVDTCHSVGKPQFFHTLATCLFEQIVAKVAIKRR